jgi:shikimate kinase / 3-dehydroquinate synthase
MPHIFLYGPPGTGKSTMGKILARNLQLPFIDLDRLVEKNAGMPVSLIIEQLGELMFRNFETSTLRALADESESVVALGGGALVREENRSFAESHGEVILLIARLETLIERLNQDPTKRPLLSGDLDEKLSALLAKRYEHYASFTNQIYVDDKTSDQNALQIQILLGRFHLRAMGEYDVIVRAHGLEQLGERLRLHGLRSPVIVTDENVAKMYGEKLKTSLRDAGLDSSLFTIPAGEGYKTLDTVNQIWQAFLNAGVDRKSTVIGLGGGVIGDLSGFAASTFMRGINWVAVPTTLLAMVDASLGGKTGFDLPEGKNLIGSFYPPKLVLADPQVLKSLPEPELISGLAEVVKHGIISDPSLFNLCRRGLDWVKGNLEEIVKRAIAVKIKVIEEDPYEKGFRAALNLGHTVGHAVELVSGFRLRHGEAVAIGIVAEAKLAERLAVAGKGLSDAIGESLSKLRLPIHIPKELPREELIHAMRMDKKKTNGVIRFALPVEIGRVDLVDVADLEMALEE